MKTWLDENRQAILQSIAQSALTKPMQDKPHKAQYLTVAELAERSHCCVHTIVRQMKAGEIPRLMLNRRHILIPLNAVLRFENEGMILAKP